MEEKLKKAIQLLETVTEKKVVLTERRHPLNESSLSRILGKHYNQTGLCVISASRGVDLSKIDVENEKEIEKAELAQTQLNNKNNKSLSKDIANAGYTYVPAYGGFIENKGSDDERTVYESSFIVFPISREGEVLNFNQFKNDMVALGTQYNQESILVKSTNGTPEYITTKPGSSEIGKKDGDYVFSGDLKVNNMLEDYFTSLSNKNKRFTFVSESASTDGNPLTYNERHKMYLRGQLFVKAK